MLHTRQPGPRARARVGTAGVAVAAPPPAAVCKRGPTAAGTWPLPQGGAANHRPVAQATSAARQAARRACAEKSVVTSDGAERAHGRSPRGCGRRTARRSGESHRLGVALRWWALMAGNELRPGQRQCRWQGQGMHRDRRVGSSRCACSSSGAEAVDPPPGHWFRAAPARGLARRPGYASGQKHTRATAVTRAVICPHCAAWALERHACRQLCPEQAFPSRESWLCQPWLGAAR